MISSSHFDPTERPHSRLQHGSDTEPRPRPELLLHGGSLYPESNQSQAAGRVEHTDLHAWKQEHPGRYLEEAEKNNPGMWLTAGEFFAFSCSSAEFISLFL